MNLSLVEEGNNVWPQCDESVENRAVYNVKFNASAFKGKSWLEAVTSVLFATGTVLRYVGSNTFAFQPIRNVGLSNKEYWFEVPTCKTEFVAYGHRELSPAAKNIKESVEFQIVENIAEIDMQSDNYREAGEIWYVEPSAADQSDFYKIPVHAYKNLMWGGIVEASQSRLLNPFAYKQMQDRQYYKYGVAHNHNVLYIATMTPGGDSFGTDVNRVVTWRSSVNIAKLAISLNFSWPVTLYENNAFIGDYIEPDTSDLLAQSIALSAKWIGISGKAQYLSFQNGNMIWSENGTADLYSYPFDRKYITGEAYSLPTLETDEPGKLEINIGAAVLFGYSDMNTGGKGLYLRLTKLSVEDDKSDPRLIAQSLLVNTVYNNKNNIALNRNPEFGSNISSMLSPAMVRNGLYIKTNSYYAGSDQWTFYNDTKQSLTVLIHQQLLSYYSKPNNVLNGELATDNPRFDALYEWNGKKHLLTSGALNVITGRMENAVLREFKRYDHMWETWVEREYFDIQGDEATYNTLVHSNKPITSADIKYLPSWATATIFQIVTSGLYGLTIKVQGNYTSEVRRGIFNVDTAFVVIDQRPAGDYGSDYYFDYS